MNLIYKQFTHAEMTSIYKCKSLPKQKRTPVTSKPIPIVVVAKTGPEASTTIGACRSYDEEQPIPSFVRSLSNKKKKPLVLFELDSGSIGINTKKFID